MFDDDRQLCSKAETALKPRPSLPVNLSVPIFGRLSQLSKKWAPRAVLAGGLGGYFAAMAAIGALALASKDLPSLETFYAPNRPVSVQILDRKGEHLLVRGAAEMQPAKLENLPRYMPGAIVTVEDRRFYAHAGVDPIGLTRAFYKNFKAGRVVEGGSTLSQQLVKNVFLTPDRTLRRKFQEMMLATWLEYNFTKTEILEAYLSRVYFGSGAWGVEAAAETYFGKTGADLTLTEAALLAGLLKAPSRYNPAASPKRAAERTAIVLRVMETRGQIDRYMRYAALSAPTHIQPPASKDSANYFADWMWDEMETLIGTPATDIVIRTTLDKHAQLAAQAAAAAHLDPARGAEQTAIVSLDGEGGVRVMVGGASYEASQFNRAAQARRQPGSAFKPFVYLTAFKSGLTPWDKRIDAPIDIGGWAPRNFTEKFKGEITLSEAFRTSVNTVAVSLSEEAGRERVIETAGELGAGEFVPLRSLALGAQVMSPLTLTDSYQAFANYGSRAPVHGILSISTASGRPLYTRPPTKSRKVIDSRSLGHINRVMVDTVTRGSGRKAKVKGRDVAGKTGTTNDYRDAWFVGFAPGRVTGVWVGADDNRPMARVTGGSIPALIWRDTMTAILEGEPLRTIPVSQEPVFELSPQLTQEKAFEAMLNDIEGALP